MEVLAKKPSISIGIPTYNRPSELEKLLCQLGKLENAGYDLEILVVDDSGNHEINTRIEALAKKILATCKYKIVKNQVNLGYPKTYIRLFEECQTDYIMIVADDDFVIEDGLNQVARFLEAVSPTFVTPQWLLDGKVHRGMTETRPINIAEFIDCSGHAPGLIYKVQEARKHLGKLAVLIDNKCAFTLTYPQTVLCLYLLLDAPPSTHPCYWLDIATAYSGAALPSGIKDASGNVYWAYTSRLRQAASLDELLHSFQETPERNRAIVAARLSFLFKIHRASGAAAKKKFARTFGFSRKIRAKVEKYIINPTKKRIKKIYLR